MVVRELMEVALFLVKILPKLIDLEPMQLGTLQKI
jgi:hypothetical protein